MNVQDLCNVRGVAVERMQVDGTDAHECPVWAWRLTRGEVACEGRLSAAPGYTPTAADFLSSLWLDWWTRGECSDAAGFAKLMGYLYETSEQRADVDRAFSDMLKSAADFELITGADRDEFADYINREV